VASLLAMFEAVIRVKSMYMIKSWSKNRKRKINLHVKDRLEIVFTACKGELMPEGVRW